MKTKSIICLAIILICSTQAIAQIDLQWVNTTGGMDLDIGNSIDVDSNKNVFIAGQFRDNVSFDPNSSNYDFTAGQFGDVFLQKFDTNGNFLWAKVFQSSEFTETPIIAIDDADNVYITSTFLDSIDLDPGIGEDIHTSTNPGDNTYIVKLNNDGDYIWGKTFENVTANQFIRPSDIAVDNSGDILITGEFQAIVDFDFSNGISSLTGLGTDGFLLKIDSDGNFVWVKQFAGNFAFFHFSCLAFDSQNNIIAGGAFKGSSPTDFDPSAGIFNMTTPDTNNNDLFILKLTEEGDFIWAKKAEGYTDGTNAKGDDRVHSIVIDNNDDILFSGAYRNTINFEPSSSTFVLDSGINGCSNCVGFMTGFIAKMDSDGDMVWAKKMEGDNFASSTGNANYYKSSIVLGLNDNQDLMFGYGYRGTLEYSINNTDVSIPGDINTWRMAFCQINPNNGDYISVFPVNNNDNIFMGNIALVDNEFFALGTYRNTLFFDSTTSISSIEASTGGFTLDAFLAKYLLPSLSLDEFDTDSFSVYPNPVNDLLHIKSRSSFDAIKIYDVNGRLLKWISKTNTSQDFKLETQDFPSGIYLLEISSEIFKLSRKFIKY